MTLAQSLMRIFWEKLKKFDKKSLTENFNDWAINLDKK